MVFPEPVVGAKAEASMNNGLLEVRVPKKNPTESTAHRVSVK
jgi:HSP20 family molecular chaperone IbpA